MSNPCSQELHRLMHRPLLSRFLVSSTKEIYRWMQQARKKELYLEHKVHVYSLGSNVYDLMSEDHIRTGVGGVFLTEVCL